MDYVARFTELARWTDDYVATDLAKVRRFENGLKLSIRSRIVGLRLQDLSYAALSSSFPWESICGFNADLWRIITDCVASQASRFLYK